MATWTLADIDTALTVVRDRLQADLAASAPQPTIDQHRHWINRLLDVRHHLTKESR